MFKKHTQKSENTLITPFILTFHANSFHSKNMLIKIPKYPLFILKINFKSNNSLKNHHTNAPNKHYFYENKYFCSH